MAVSQQACHDEVASDIPVSPYGCTLDTSHTLLSSPSMLKPQARCGAVSNNTVAFGMENICYPTPAVV